MNRRRVEWRLASPQRRSPIDVDGLLASTGATAAAIGRLGARTFWGGYLGTFMDPDRHAWGMAHKPGWVLADDGSVRPPA